MPPPTATIMIPYTALDDLILRGPRASQPAASAVTPGTLYSVTDEGARLERSDGTTWALYAPIASGTGAPADAHYLTTQAESGLSAETNLGALGSGLLKQTVSGGVSTPAIAVPGTDYGTVTHATGALTGGRLVFGNGGADVTVGDLSGDIKTLGAPADGGTGWVAQIQPAAVTTAKIADQNVTAAKLSLTTGPRLLGAAAAGAAAELALDPGLQLLGGVLGPKIRGCKAYHGTTQALAGATWTMLQFGANSFDSDSYHDGAVNNTRITIPLGLGGVYVLHSYALCQLSSGYMTGRFVKNGTSPLIPESRGYCGSIYGGLVTFAIANLAAGEYVECQLQTEAPCNVGIVSAPEQQSTFAAIRLGVL